MEETTKPWFKSKIVLLALSAIFVFGSNMAMGWLSGQGVTPEQMTSLRIAYPEIADAVARAQAGENVLNVVASLFGVLVLVFRTWFTKSGIA